MTPVQRMHATLLDGRTIYMILTYQTRSRAHRSYRLFTIDEMSLEDITSQVCKAIGVEWNNVTGTYTSKEPYRFEDGPALAKRISQSLGWPLAVPVVVL